MNTFGINSIMKSVSCKRQLADLLIIKKINIWAL